MFELSACSLFITGNFSIALHLAMLKNNVSKQFPECLTYQCRVLLIRFFHEFIPYFIELFHSLVGFSVFVKYFFPGAERFPDKAAFSPAVIHCKCNVIDFFFQLRIFNNHHVFMNLLAR